MRKILRFDTSLNIFFLKSLEIDKENFLNKFYCERLKQRGLNFG